VRGWALKPRSRRPTITDQCSSFISPEKPPISPAHFAHCQPSSHQHPPCRDAGKWPSSTRSNIQYRQLNHIKQPEWSTWTRNQYRAIPRQYRDNTKTTPRQHRDNTETTSWQHRTVSKTKMNDWITEYWSRSHILCSKKTDSKFPNQLETQSETVDYPITKLSPASSNQLKTVSRAIIHKRVWSIWNFFLNAKLGCAIPSSIPCPANEIYQVEIQ